MDVIRSPRNLDMIRAATGAYPFVPGIDHVTAIVGETVVPTTFSLNVEAATEHCDGGNGGDRRVPNHNLLKQVCDVIVGVHNGKGALAGAPDSDVEGSVVMAIEALVRVQTVHRVSKID
ncbi:unnamed protein product [Hyaloperonospora brassicae]|uniref:Uncharacterized protein n=1 Tax=Hyaloperonospora brassicae TaxID=162125 RepID=A0AAV0SUH9_HYABA|nr:unnamed protein product [Hyaloperonospora brassicae]